jgi:23S rRNA pseudouridine1911/1915/1917 synthase
MRLDAYLAKNRPEYSRAVWQKFIKAGYVTVNGQAVTGFKAINDETKIDVNLPEVDDKPLDLPVIYEDDNVVVIDKPAGILSHSKGALNTEPTVADFIRQRSAGSDLPDNNRFGIVHRLDRGTSGVMIGAKNAAALKKLQRQFSDRKAKKTYLAVVEKAPDNSEFTIDLPIGRNLKQPASFRVDAKGKPAVTDVKLDQILPSGRALLELKPRTGRTHQLRVHLAYIGAPIIGDVMYGSADATPRMLLHAAELEITLPSGDRKVFKALLPPGFKESK